MMRVAVLGLGYVGLTTAIGMGKLGHQVLGFDVDVNKVRMLSKGASPIFEEGLDQALVSLIDSENLNFTEQLESLRDFKPEYLFICVATPQDESGDADLSILFSVVTQMASIAPKDAILVVKSTVPVGTGRRILESIKRDDVAVVSNPEFLREGTAIKDFLEPDRIVVGSDSSESAERVLALYADIDAPKVKTGLESSELIKYAANAYLAMRLSFTNDMAALAENTNANVDEVLRGMGLDKRIGSSFLKPGPGWGGSCFPKDTNALLALAKNYGSPLPLVESTIASNRAALARSVDVIKKLVGGNLTNKTIAVWGVAFKADTDDVRDSPALKIIQSLLNAGAIVKAYDPVALAPDQSGLSRSSSALDAVAGADLLAVLTEWPEFAEVPAEVVAAAMNQSIIFDARRILPESWKSHVSLFKAIGEPNK